MSGTHAVLLLLAFALTLTGCTSPSAPAASSGLSVPISAAPPTTLVMVINIEVLNLAQKAVGAVSPGRTTRLFNAGLTLADPPGNAHPYLAQALPQLNTDTWQVFPDGRMETTWKLRPGLTWHDGQPLTAEDFAFAFRVYAAPDLRGVFTPKPQDIVERIVAVDPQTVRISWRSPFLHQGDGLEPLPRHILAEPFAAFEQDPPGQRDPFMSARFWTTEYVGAGPYKLTNWVPASHLEGEAFDGHALGRPRIDRIVVRSINDENTVLANMLAGEAQFVMTDVIGPEQAETLRRQGGFNDVDKKGTLLPTSTAAILADPQHRLDRQQTPALHDPRVRKALAHATDKHAINDALYDGQGFIPDTLMARQSPIDPQIDAAITKYPYDLRRSEQLMNEAGYVKGQDRFYLDAAGQRLQPALWNPPRAFQERFLSLMVRMWQEAGFDPQPLAMSRALSRDQETNATFPGILLAGVGGIGNDSGGATSLTSEQIATPANRWNGSNRGGWSNPEYDLLWNRYNTTLDRAEQIQAVVGMMKLQTEHLPKFPLYYLMSYVAHVATVQGPQGDSSHWNVHAWEMR